MEAVKVFLDTNVVLDYYTGRMGDSIAKTIVMAGQTPQIELCISILTAVNVLYVSRKYNSPLKAKDIAELFQILPMDYQHYCEAQSIDINDFEDALQICCARQSGCKVMVTRDKELLDGGSASALILSPEEFLQRIGLRPQGLKEATGSHL